MSNSNPKLPSVNVYEPRMELLNERQWVNLIGPEQSTFYQIAATGYSNSNIQFNCIPPSVDAALDRQVFVKVPVTLTFSGTGAGGPDNIVQPGRDAFRAYPISSCATTLQLQLNGFSTTIELSQMIHALSRFHSTADERHDFNSLSPTFEDCYQVYADGDGANNNPLGGYINQACNNQLPRGAYPYTVVSNSPTAAVITADLYERVYIPPIIWQKLEAGGLTKLTSLQFIYTLGNLEHMWSRSTANTQNLTSLSVNIGSPTIYLNWLTPKLSELARMPDVISYPYFSLQRFTNTGQNSLAPNTSATFQTQVINFDTIPEKIYLFLKKPDSTILNTTLAQKVNSTDTFCAINSISINFDNQNGVLSQASAAALWQMSVKNGLVMSYPEFIGVNQVPSAVGAVETIGLTGSILGICPGVDFPLRSGLAPGMLGKWQFQASINATNVNQVETYIPDVYVIAVYSGVMHLRIGSCEVQQGVATVDDVLNGPVADIGYNELMAVYGGSFGSKFRDFIKRGWNWVKDHKSDIAKIAMAAAPLIGLGEEAEAGARAGNGGILYGGKMMSRKDLAKRLKKH